MKKQKILLYMINGYMKFNYNLKIILLYHFFLLEEKMDYII